MLEAFDGCKVYRRGAHLILAFAFNCQFTRTEFLFSL